MMKRFWIAGLSTIGLMVMAPAVTIVSGWDTRPAIAQTAEKPQIKLTLTGEKRIVSKDAQGKERITWEKVGQQVTAQTGDVLRYSLKGKNEGKGSAKNLVLTQPIPQNTIYFKDSATKQAGVEILFSIDGGKNYSAAPMVEVKTLSGKVEVRPAPLESYTHVRWKWQNSIAPQGEINVAYQVRVK